MASSLASSSFSLTVSVLLAALVVVLLAGGGPAVVAAQSSSASAPSSSSSSSGSCLTEMVSLYPCLGFISGSKGTSKPSASCCSALSSVVSSNPRCLCTVLGGGASSLGVTVNTTRALQLPGACSVKTPPPSDCNSVGVNVPSTSPSPATPSPSTATPASPPTASVPAAPADTAAGTGTKATQTAVESSGGKAATAPVLPPVAVVLLSAAVALLHA